MITFSFRPTSGSTLPLIAASVRTFVVSWKEAADRKEEQDKQIEEAQEKRKNQEEIIEGQQNADQLEQDVSMQKQNTSKMDEAQKNIQKILKEKNLVNEDLKGIEIDLNF